VEIDGALLCAVSVTATEGFVSRSADVNIGAGVDTNVKFTNDVGEGVVSPTVEDLGAVVAPALDVVVSAALDVVSAALEVVVSAALEVVVSAALEVVVSAALEVVVSAALEVVVSAALEVVVSAALDVVVSAALDVVVMSKLVELVIIASTVVVPLGSGVDSTLEVVGSMPVELVLTLLEVVGSMTVEVVLTVLVVLVDVVSSSDEQFEPVHPGKHSHPPVMPSQRPCPLQDSSMEHVWLQAPYALSSHTSHAGPEVPGGHSGCSHSGSGVVVGSRVVYRDVSNRAAVVTKVSPTSHVAFLEVVYGTELDSATEVGEGVSKNTEVVTYRVVSKSAGADVSNCSDVSCSEVVTY